MTPFCADELVTIYHGDCVEVMAELPAESVDAIVTDPPYGLEFMGKEWDRLGAELVTDVTKKGGHQDGNGGNAYSRSRIAFGKSAKTMQVWHEAWAREAFRVAKPGAHLLAFGGTRTYHRLACAIEDAGWEIRDCLVWAYASGFPKSLNIGNGMGTALKPAWEPIVMARKPLRGTVAANVQQYGTGALNIDATRIGWRDPLDAAAAAAAVGYAKSMAAERTDNGTSLPATYDKPPYEPDKMSGRWPANLLLTDPIFDGDTPGVVGGGTAESTNANPYPSGGVNGESPFGPGNWESTYGDAGTYSRFFLVPKSSRSDREPLVRGENAPQRDVAGVGALRDGGRPSIPRANLHPTVKPLDLMRHLVRLVTPPGGTVLDCFLGSGTTAIAANAEGFRCIGIEKEREYLDIALARMAHQPLGMAL